MTMYPLFSKDKFANVGPRQESLYIGLLGLLLFTFGLWNQPFVGFDARFALFAQEMWRHGPSLFPTTYGEPYPDYPSTSTVLIWLVSHPFGTVTKLSAVLPTALAAALNLTITYRLLASFSRQWAILAVGFEILTVTFLAEARSISLDQMVATVTLLSFYLTYTGCRDQQPARLRWLPVLLIAGFAIRGPLGAVIPAGVVCSYYLLSAQWHRLLVFAATAALVLAVCWAVLLGAADHFYGGDFARDVIHMQVTGRVEASEHPQHWYYLTSSFGNYALAYPVAMMAVLLLTTTQLNFFGNPPHDDTRYFLIFLIGWVLVVIVGLSIPDAKKARYLLPIVPAIAALAAYPLRADDEVRKQRALHFFAMVMERLFLILPLLVMIGVAFANRYAHKDAAQPQLSFPLIFVLLVCYQTVALVVQQRAKNASRTTGLLLVAVLTVWTVNSLIVEPVGLQLHDTRKFVQKVEALRQQRQGDISFFRVGKDAAAIKYLVNLDYDLRPYFFSESAAVDAYRGGASYLIVEDDQLAALRASARVAPLKPVLHHRFDHHFYSVFYLE